jgi:hypothetical protein
MKNLPRRCRQGFPPLERQCECGDELKRHQRRDVQVLSLWGKVSQARWRYRCEGCGKSVSLYEDESLDESGCLPEVLVRLQESTTLLSYRQAESLLGRWGVITSKSQLHALSQQFETTQHKEVSQQLQNQAGLALPRSKTKGKRYIIEIDGVLVPTLTETAQCEWRELKVAVLYPMRNPYKRLFCCHLGTASDFAPLVHGLLRQAGLTQADELIGISDGAVWIAELMGDLGVHRHILDVFHASTYLETLMLALGWEEPLRTRTRHDLLRGHLDVQRWLNTLSPTERTTLNDEAQKALRYLEKQAALDHTTYPKFKHEGIEVIGSGQIEGANKAVFSQRLKLSGARWLPSLANAKALARAEYYAAQPIVEFHQIRKLAFPQRV